MGFAGNDAIPFIRLHRFSPRERKHGEILKNPGMQRQVPEFKGPQRLC